MELIADILLVAGALGAAFYCFVLGRRLNRFNDLEKGVGGAVAVLSAQVDDLGKALANAQSTASKSTEDLGKLVARAEETARQLELQMASLHDLDEPYVSSTASEDVSTSRPSEQNSEPMFIRRRVETGAH